MTQCQLDRAIASATGESVDLIRHRGFGLLTPDRPACRHRPPRRRSRRPSPRGMFPDRRAVSQAPAA